MKRLGFSRTALLLCCGLLADCAPSAPPPAPAPPPVAQEPMIYVVVERGQSLDAIAKRYRITKQRIIAANKLTPPFSLKPGLVLAIPLSAAGPPAKKTATKPRSTEAVDSDETPSAPPKSARPKRPPPEVIPLD
jgi:LysM repeat protein